MSEYRLTPRAEQGLLRIAQHVQECLGSGITDRVLASIEAALIRLGDMPDTGHRRADITVDDTIRFWSVGPTLIAYRRDCAPIVILFIERGEMDWERLIGEQAH